jgi:hypothetical protein
VPASQVTEWKSLANNVQIARGGYNQIVTKYNAAIAQFPARLVAGIMQFKQAALL